MFCLLWFCCVCYKLRPYRVYKMLAGTQPSYGPTFWTFHSIAESAAGDRWPGHASDDGRRVSVSDTRLTAVCHNQRETLGMLAKVACNADSTSFTPV